MPSDPPSRPHDPPAGALPGTALRERRPDERRPPGDVGAEPDPRFTLANERTFLAWNRTALALVSAGAGAAAFLDRLGDARLVVAVPLILAGGAMAWLTFRRWDAIERALRLGEPMPYARTPQLLGAFVAVMASVLAILVVVEVIG